MTACVVCDCRSLGIPPPDLAMVLEWPEQKCQPNSLWHGWFKGLACIFKHSNAVVQAPPWSCGRQQGTRVMLLVWLSFCKAPESGPEGLAAPTHRA